MLYRARGKAKNRTRIVGASRRSADAISESQLRLASIVASAEAVSDHVVMRLVERICWSSACDRL